MTPEPQTRWHRGSADPSASDDAVRLACRNIREPVHVVKTSAGALAVVRGGTLDSELRNGAPTLEHVATLPPLWPERLGGPAFTTAHNVRFPYIVGEMANGIATAPMVIAAARAGFLGFFGAAGLSHASITKAIDTIEAGLRGTGLSWGANLIHSPNEPDLESGTAALFLDRRVTRVSASAYMGLTAPVVRYAFAGVRRRADGTIFRPNAVIAKISRPEVAARFLTPPPADMLRSCVERGWLSAEEAALAANLPVAEDITVEADSGGHTDNRPLVALFPLLRAQRDVAAAKTGRAIRIGAAGGLGTPDSVAAAFLLGADYVLTGSINQAAVESGLSPEGRQMLCAAGVADVIMAPAADMFELGVTVQVLRRGTMFGVRAQQLYDVYKAVSGLDQIPPDTLARLEKELFRMPVAAVVAETERFWSRRDPRENEKAARDPKHRMALVFRWYLGLASRWAISGEAERRMDYQIWCGPAQGAFNAWAAGTFLEAPENRTVAQMGRNLLEGAAVLTRAQQLRAAGVSTPSFEFRPRPLG